MIKPWEMAVSQAFTWITKGRRIPAFSFTENYIWMISKN